MKDELTVIYNGSCPICSREIAMYRARAERADAHVRFLDLTETDLEPYGLTRDSAARRFYAVAPDGGLIEGVPAFAAMWERLPGLSWLARIVRLPGLRSIAEVVYNKVAAPALYRMHLRRQKHADSGAA
jgi:predicted DCC family thiol-disulfide oxidoreductase YuxK